MPISAHLFTEDIKRPALVLVHGLGSAGSIWKSLIPQLTKDFSVFAVDLPGHGLAGLHENEAVDPESLARAIVEEVSTTHDVTEMHVAGNSLGGWIALEMGAIAPDKVKSVTALAPAGLWHEGQCRNFHQVSLMLDYWQKLLNTLCVLPITCLHSRRLVTRKLLTSGASSALNPAATLSWQWLIQRDICRYGMGYADANSIQQSLKM